MELNLSEKIRELRKTAGLTQKQLAESLGVSPAAVSKWETNKAYPDLTLLSPLARALKTSLDALLDFSPRLSLEEVRKLEDACREAFETKPFMDAVALCEDAVKTYPGDGYLCLRIASLYMRNLCACPDDAAAQAQLKRCIFLFERCLEDGLKEVSDAALHVLPGLYQMAGDLDKALKTVERLPQGMADARMLRAGILQAKGEESAALELHQAVLWDKLRDAGLSLYSIAGIHKKLGNSKRAMELIQTAKSLDRLFYLDARLGQCSNYALFEASLYMEENQPERALDALEEFVHAYLELPLAPLENAFFDRLQLQIDGRSRSSLRKNARFLLAETDAFAPLRGDPRFEAFLRRLEP